MLEQVYDKLITKSKFQKASIFINSPTQSLVTLGTLVDEQKENDYSQASTKYSYQSYVSLGQKELYQLKNQRVFDLRKDETQNMVVFKENELFGFDTFQHFLEGAMQSILTQNKIPSSFEECKILKHLKLLNISESRRKIKLFDLFDPLKPEQIKLYDLDQIQQGFITTLHLLSDQMVLFNIGCQYGDHYNNSELKCLDIQYQQIQWEEKAPSYTVMTHKIINITRTNFIQGRYNRQGIASLRLYDRRLKGTVLNVLHSDLEIWERLNQQWTGSGNIREDYDNICKHPSEYIVVGMFSFRSGSYSFPYIMDLRKPGTIIPYNFPDRKPLSHLKCFEMDGNNIVALEREYSSYSFKQGRLCYYELTNG